MKAAYHQGHFTNQTWLFERKGNFDPNEIKFKVLICFKVEIKTWDLIIDSKYSEPILPSAGARGNIFEANKGKRMCAPVSRHTWLKSGSYFSLNCSLEVSMCLVSLFGWQVMTRYSAKIFCFHFPKILLMFTVPGPNQTINFIRLEIYIPSLQAVCLGIMLRIIFDSVLRPSVTLAWNREFSVIFVALMLSGAGLPFRLKKGRKVLAKLMELGSDTERCLIRKRLKSKA